MTYEEPKYAKEYIEEWTPLYGKYAEGVLKSIHKNKYITDGLMDALDKVRKKMTEPTDDQIDDMPPATTLKMLLKYNK
jgi:hypothetical protein